MSEEHRLVQVVSHVTSFVGRIGVIGLCSCGWLAGEEGEDTRVVVLRLNQAWEAHDRGEAPPNRASWPLPPAVSSYLPRGLPRPPSAGRSGGELHLLGLRQE